MRFQLRDFIKLYEDFEIPGKIQIQNEISDFSVRCCSSWFICKLHKHVAMYANNYS